MSKQQWHMLHKRFNDVLSTIVFGLGVYLIAAPFLPELNYWYHQTVQPYPKESQYVNQALTQTEEGVVESVYPQKNILFIPKIGVDAQVVQSNNSNVLNTDLWLRPHTKTPPEKGNTVIVAHRFQYTSGPKTFYNLDKLTVGDTAIIYWEGKKYEYAVYNISVVAPDETQIEAETDEPILTLYTCTPLWTARNRLVVRARLIT